MKFPWKYLYKKLTRRSFETFRFFFLRNFLEGKKEEEEDIVWRSEEKNGNIVAKKRFPRRLWDIRRRTMITRPTRRWHAASLSSLSLIPTKLFIPSCNRLPVGPTFLSLSLLILLLSPIHFLPSPSILLSRNRLFLVIKSFKVLRALVKNDEKNLPRWLPTIEDKCLRVLQSSTCTRYDTLFRCVWFPLPSFFFFHFSHFRQSYLATLPQNYRVASIRPRFFTPLHEST